MTYMLLCEDFIKNRVEKGTLKELENSSEVRKAIFNNLTVGVNVISTESYQKIAAWLFGIGKLISM